MLRSMKYGLHGAVLAGLIAAPVVWHTVDKSVHLVVDGNESTISTTASDVGEVVHTAGYQITGHDLLAPARANKVHDGMRVVLRRGRLLLLDIDGRRTRVWTTAPTVQAALEQLGFASADYVSVSRARRLPLRPTSLAIRTPRIVTVVHDGKREEVTTTDPTVGELLADIGVAVGKNDRISAPADTALYPGQVVRVQRIGKRVVTRTEPLKYSINRHKDSRLIRGRTHVVRTGKNGRAKVTYALVYVDGKMTGKEKLKSVTLSAPRTEIVKVGTKKPPTVANVPNSPIPAPGTAKAIARDLLPDYGFDRGTQYPCLTTLWGHESAWHVDASNPSGAYGIPQALPGSKMSSAGPNWQTNATTQIKWGLGYIKSRYGTPCDAWSFWQSHNYY